MTKTFSSTFYAGVRIALMASVFLGPVAGLAAWKNDERRASGKGAGFVLLISLQRGALS
jgi:hypothetical protein